jgi:hypothetical protein
VGDGPPAIPRILAGQSYYPDYLLRGESRGGSTARRIGKHPLYTLPQRLLGGLLRCGQKLLGIRPHPSPQARRLPIYPEHSGDPLVVVAFGGGQDDARPAHQSLGTARASRQVLKRLALSIREYDRVWPWSWHDGLGPFA